MFEKWYSDNGRETVVVSGITGTALTAAAESAGCIAERSTTGDGVIAADRSVSRFAESMGSVVSRDALVLRDRLPNNHGVAMTTIAVRARASKNRLSIALGRLDHGTGS
jgi:hypothetical protein